MAELTISIKSRIFIKNTRQKIGGGGSAFSENLGPSFFPRGNFASDRLREAIKFIFLLLSVLAFFETGRSLTERHFLESPTAVRWLLAELDTFGIFEAFQ